MEKERPVGMGKSKRMDEDEEVRCRYELYGCQSVATKYALSRREVRSSIAAEPAGTAAATTDRK